MNNRYIFLIASHINDIKRVETMKRALISIAINDPDYIYISYSVEPQFISQISEFEIKWKNELKNTPHLFLYQTERKMQFEHYNILREHVLDTDIVSFSDDDDITSSDKVQVLKEYLENLGPYHGILHDMGEFGGLEFNEEIPDKEYMKMVLNNRLREYVCLSIKGWLFKDWFVNNHNYILDEKYTSFDELMKEHQGLIDCLFKLSLEKHVLAIPNILYYHRYRGNGIPRAY